MYDIIAEVTVAVLAFAGTLAGSIMVSQKTTWRLDQLEKKQDALEAEVKKHNRLVERVFLLEHDAEIQQKLIDELREHLEREKE